MKTYKELSRVASTYYPKEKNYCAVIAVAVVTNVSYGKARSHLFKLGRLTGRGTKPVQTYMALRNLGHSPSEYKGTYPKTLATATRILPKRGTFTIHTRGHISVVKDGVLQDWAAITGSRKRILSINEIQKDT